MKLGTRDMILISLFAALTAIGAFIKVPTPLVPFTLQFLFCTFAGLLLGSKQALYSQSLYIFIGLIGVPIFANGGGLTYLLQPTFGYLIGFAACAYLVGFFVEHKVQIKFWSIFGIIILGLMVDYICGVSYLYLVVNFYLQKEMSVWSALLVGFIPYVTFDVLQSALIALTAVKIVPILRRAGYGKIAHISGQKDNKILKVL